MASILVPFDGSPAGEYVLAVACRSAGHNGDEVRAVYVIRVRCQLPISADLPTERARAGEVLDRAHALADRHDACLTTMIAEAREAGPAIVAAAQDCDCIMMGQRARRRFYERVLLDRTLRYVVAHAPCPVLVVYMPPRWGDTTRRFLLLRPPTPGQEPSNVSTLRGYADAL